MSAVAVIIVSTLLAYIAYSMILRDAPEWSRLAAALLTGVAVLAFINDKLDAYLLALTGLVVTILGAAALEEDNHQVLPRR